MTDRHETDTFDIPPPGDMAWRLGQGQGFQQAHPSEPVDREPPTRPARRVRPRPHRKYTEPSEMWEWHWVRMRVVLAWTMVGTSCGVVGTAAWVILGEFI